MNKKYNLRDDQLKNNLSLVELRNLKYNKCNRLHFMNNDSDFKFYLIINTNYKT